jgi:hypothetical protein
MQMLVNGTNKKRTKWKCCAENAVTELKNLLNVFNNSLYQTVERIH